MQRKVALIYPKGTCKAPAFYFRGGDGFSEPENLRSQYKAAIEQYNKTKRQLTIAQNEYNQTSAELEDLDECILKIASNMGAESQETTENSILRNKIQQLQMDIQDVENQIAETNQQCLPFEFSGLVNERAQFTPSIRDLRETIANDKAPQIKREIGQILISERFSESVESLIEKHVALEVKNQLRQQVNASQNAINGQGSADTGIINKVDDEDIMQKIAYLRDVTLDALESQIQLDLAETHHRIFLKMEIDRLEEMNEYLTLMKKETVDTQAVYDKCNEDISDDESNHNYLQNVSSEEQMEPAKAETESSSDHSHDEKKESDFETSKTSSEFVDEKDSDKENHSDEEKEKSPPKSPKSPPKSPKSPKSSKSPPKSPKSPPKSPKSPKSSKSKESEEQ